MKKRLIAVFMAGAVILSGAFPHTAGAAGLEEMQGEKVVLEMQARSVEVADQKVNQSREDTDNILQEAEVQEGEDNNLNTAGEAEESDFEYRVLEEGTIEITGYKGDNRGNLVIPGTIDGHTVTSIGDSAFYRNDCTGSLILPNSLISIGNMAFSYSRFTGNLVLPESIENIGDEAFYQCNFAGDLILPDSLVRIGSKAFVESWYGSWSKTHSLICNKMPEDTSSTAFFEELVIGGCYGNMRVGEKIKLIVSGVWDCENGIIREIKNNSNSVYIDNNGIITAISDGQAKIQITAYNGETAELNIRVYGDEEKVQKGNIAWYIPERIKLGYKYRDDTAALHNSIAYSGVAIAEVKNLPIDSVGKYIRIKTHSLHDHFSLPFTYNPSSMIQTNEVEYLQFEGYYAIRPGKVTCQLEVGQYSQNPDEPSIWVGEPLGDPYTVIIEEPIIETNEPKQITVGDSFTLRSELQNTYLQNESVEYYKEKVKDLDSPAMCAGGNPVYVPEFVIESGAELIECSKEDFTHTLTASEDIIFKKSGTVKIKIRYNLLEKYAFVTNPQYSPEKTITIQVKEKGQDKNGKKDKKVSSIRISGISRKIAAGKKIKLKAEVFPSDAANKKVQWESSNTKIATVNQSGIVTLNKKSGGKSVKITAVAMDGSGVKSQYKITVMKDAVKKITILGGKSVKAGRVLKLKAKVAKTGKKANTKLKWTSNNTKYATVNASGKVKTYKAGKGKKVKITAEATDGSKKKKTVTIKIK